MDVGAGDGRFVLSRASEHPEELVLAIDASHAAMREASWRAGRTPRRGGLPNALFVASSLEALPGELAGCASLVTVHFAWGSLLDAAIGRDPNGADRLASLVAARGTLHFLLSASDRDAGRGVTTLDAATTAEAIACRGFAVVASRPATLADVAAARSTWGRRLLVIGGERRAWLLELRRVESAGGGAMPRLRP